MTAPSAIPAPREAAGARRRWSDLLPRLASGVVMIGAALGTAVLGGDGFAAFWLLATGAIVWEWQRLVGRPGATLRTGLGVLALAIAVPCLASGRPGAAVLAVLAGTMAAAVSGGGSRTMAALGVAYAGALAIAAVALRASPGGLSAILWLFAVVWGTDIFAYFGGRLIGGPKVWTRLSPSKTWAGFLVGVTAGALAGVAVAPADHRSVALLLIGLVAAVLAQAGDFLESAIKRRYGVKDSSRLIPGHGGVMDRLDGFAAAAVFAFALGAASAGWDQAAAGLFNWA